MIPDWCDKEIEWSDIKIGGDVYMISITWKNDAFQVLLTNLIEIWVETLTEEHILQKCKKLNPLLSVDSFIYNEIVTNILSNIPKYVIEASVEQIKLRAPLAGGIVKFNLDLLKESPQYFWENITKPLCLSSMELVRQRKILIDLVERKDEEIAEYKAEGAELIRKNIETKPFSRDQFKADFPPSNFSDWTKAFQRMITFYNTLNIKKTEVKKDDRPNEKPASSTGDQNVSAEQTKQDAPTSTKSGSANSSGELGFNNSVRAKRDTSKSNDAERDMCSSYAQRSPSKMKAMNMIYKHIKKQKRSLNDFIR